MTRREFLKGTMVGALGLCVASTPMVSFAATNDVSPKQVDENGCEIIAEFSFSELDCILKKGEFSNAELNVLRSYGYTEAEILTLTHYSNDILLPYKDIVDGTAVCHGYIAKIYFANNEVAFRLVWNWSAKPQLLDDAVTVKWVAYNSSGGNIGSNIGNCAATIGLSNGSNKYYSQSKMDLYDASDAIALEFNMGTSSAYAKTGNLDVYLSVSSGNMHHIDVEGVYYHQHREGTWGLGLPPSFSAGYEDKVYLGACSGTIR